MIQSTTQDLEDHLQEVSTKLEALSTRATSSTNIASGLERQRIQDEKNSTEQCLMICGDVLSHINKMRLLPLPEGSSAITDITTLSLQDLNHSHIITISTLLECSDKLEATVSQLKAHEMQNRLQQSRPAELNPVYIAKEAQKLQDERLSVQQCLAICTEASGNANSDRIHTLEDVTMGHNGQQIFVSTLGDLFRLKGVSAGDDAIQFVGSVSDETLQYYFQHQQR